MDYNCENESCNEGSLQVTCEINMTRRLIPLTPGNLRNNHVYITQHHDFFPKECYGEAKAGKGTGKKLKLIVDGLPEAVETDIAKNRNTGRPRNFFRRRAWVGRFFKHHGLREGDVIAIERLDRFIYRVYPLESRRQASGVPLASELEKICQQL